MRGFIRVLAAVPAGAAGCAVEPMPLEKRDEAAAGGHICVDGGWKVIDGHRHGPGFGHALVDGKWMKSEGDTDSE